MNPVWKAYKEYFNIVENGDTSSPEYFGAREFYEDMLAIDCKLSRSMAIEASRFVLCPTEAAMLIREVA